MNTGELRHVKLLSRLVPAIVLRHIVKDFWLVMGVVPGNYLGYTWIVRAAELQR